MFWIHGGGNLFGTGSDATFDGGSLATRADAVVVTITHRLNIFGKLSDFSRCDHIANHVVRKIGFLALNDTNITGNYALADKIASLQWVQEHIAAFGGDPNRVMIFGQSAGGWSVVDLVVSPKAAGLFSSAISLSGGSGSLQTIDEATAMAGMGLLCSYGRYAYAS
jgi:carboxylesterase type B